MAFTNFGLRTESQDLKQIVGSVFAEYGIELDEKNTTRWVGWVKRQLIDLDASGRLVPDKEVKAAVEGIDGKQFRADFYKEVGMDAAEIEQDEALVNESIRYYDANKIVTPSPDGKKNKISAPEDFNTIKAQNFENRVQLVEQLHMAAAKKAQEKATKTRKSSKKKVGDISDLSGIADDLISQINGEDDLIMG